MPQTVPEQQPVQFPLIPGARVLSAMEMNNIRLAHSHTVLQSDSSSLTATDSIAEKKS